MFSLFSTILHLAYRFKNTFNFQFRKCTTFILTCGAFYNCSFSICVFACSIFLIAMGFRLFLFTPKILSYGCSVVTRSAWDKVFKNGLSKICGIQPIKTSSDMVCFNRSYYIISIFNFFFQGCLPQILLGPLLNTFFHILLLDVDLKRRI